MPINVLDNARQLGGYLLNTEDFKDSPTKRALPWLIWSLINSTYLRNQVFSRLQNPCISFSLQPFQLFESGWRNHCICPFFTIHDRVYRTKAAWVEQCIHDL